MRIGIIASTNHQVAIQQRRIAEATVALGLPVTFYVATLGREGESLDRFRVAGADSDWLPLPSLVRRRGASHPLMQPLVYQAVCRFIDVLEDHCFLTSLDSGYVYRIIHYAAQKRRLPAFVVQEGMTNTIKRYGKFRRPPRMRMVERPLGVFARVMQTIPHPLFRPYPFYTFAQYACVWGEAMKRHLVAMGRDANTVFVTGSPAFDHVTARRPLCERAPRAVLYAQQSQGDEGARWEFYRHLVKTCADDLECELLFKLHPHAFHEAARIRDLVSQSVVNRDRVKVLDKGDAVGLFGQASVLLTICSTTAYHAMLAGMPLVLVNYLTRQLELKAAPYGAAIGVEKPEDLRGSLRRALDDQDVRTSLYRGADAMLKDHLYQLDGNAARRVAERVRSVVQRWSRDRREGQ